VCDDITPVDDIGESGVQHVNKANFVRSSRWALCAGVSSTLVTPRLALAQTSPFMTGATALQTNVLAWLTPVAIILIMVLGAMAMANRIAWGWVMAALLGIAISFGAPQIVTWVRGMFGV
jgi:type IV secretion system protein VirB2